MNEGAPDPTAEAKSPDRRVVRRRVIGFTAGAVVLVAFFIGVWLNVHYRLPDENDPAVKADTARAVAAIEADIAARAGSAAAAACTARLLDRDGDGTLYVHAVCATTPGPAQTAGPYRVDPDGTVRTARDGDRFAQDVKAMFGSRLGDWYLNHRESFAWMRPPETPGVGTRSPVP